MIVGKQPVARCWWLRAVALTMLAATPMEAAPVSASAAGSVVRGWLRHETRPLRAALGADVQSVDTYRDAQGDALYHVIVLKPAGFVVVPADDGIEPIVAFSPKGTFDASDRSPIGALVSRDLAARVAETRGSPASARGGGAKASLRATRAHGRWAQLTATRAVPTRQTATGSLQTAGAIVSDVRVAPLLASKWGQDTVAGMNVFNYYTPNNDYAGCVATAMAQLMYYFRLPAAGVGTPAFTIWVSGAPQSRNLRGGDGAGGPYAWSSMVDVPDGAITLTQRKAIGALACDAGVAVGMDYDVSGSSASCWDAATALVNTFGYGNSVCGYNWGYNIGDDGLNGMINPNLDAGLPVILALRRNTSGHAVVCDGYGYQGGTIYHHLNMGWDGLDDAWYNLPDVNAYYQYSSVDTCVYNIYPTGGGEIISGRIVTTNGNPLAGVTVTAVGGDGTLRAVTGNNGIYALTHAVAERSYTVSVSMDGYQSANRATWVGRSRNYQAAAGNCWGVDFSLVAGPPPNRPPAFAPLDDQAARYGQSLSFVVAAADPEGATPSLALLSGPDGAAFNDNGDGTAGFAWTPARVADIGEHTAVFIASDGALTATCTVTIAVASFAVAAPAGTVARAGDDVTVTWSGSWSLGAVDVELWKGTQYRATLTNAMPVQSSDATCRLPLPPALPCGDDYWVLVRATAAPADRALSDLFAILPRAHLDFDGDGLADLAGFNSDNGRIQVIASKDGQPMISTIGKAAWRPAVADYDGDGKADFAWFVPASGTWRILESAHGCAERLPRPVLGGSADLPVPADYDGDGLADPAVFRGYDGRIRVQLSGSGQTVISASGYPTWKPAVADYDGDGKADFAWFVPASGAWRIFESAHGYAERLPRPVLGGSADLPVPADYDGDGKADPAVFRGGSGQIRAQYSSDGSRCTSSIGNPAWLPAVADYDGDGKTDFAWFLPAKGRWRILESSHGYAERLPRPVFGVSADRPVATPLLGP